MDSPNNTQMNLQNLLKELAAPIPYQWRVQSRSKDRTKAICTAYIDARDVMNVLDKHCAWESTFKEVGGFIFAGIKIHTPEGSYERWDSGQRVETNPDDQMYDQAGKAAASDAFKRAAVMWGVGRFLYDLPMVTLPCDQYGNVVDSNGQRVWDLTKHINGMQDKKPAPSVKPTPEPQSLPQDKFDAMVKYITEGKIKEVESAMKKYELNDNQRKLLTNMIAQKKQDTLIKAAKK